MLRRRGYQPALFNSELFGSDFLSSFFNNDEQTYTTMPSVNIGEDKDNFIIEVAAPGFDKKDFKIDLNNNTLEISSEKKLTNEDESNKTHRREFCYASFNRTFTLPDSVNTEEIKATYNDGILNIQIPKREEAKVKPPRQIDIV